jgi:hypothetical protein
MLVATLVLASSHRHALVLATCDCVESDVVDIGD